MIKYSHFILIPLIGLAACDDGKIYPEEYVDEISGREIILNADFTHVDQWPANSSRQLVLAGYKNDDRTPLISITIPQPEEEGGSVSLTMRVPEEVDRISIAELNRTRLLQFQYYSYTLSGSGPVTLPIQSIDLKKFNHVQEIFNASCIICHGGNNSAAANLYLTEGKSYEALVNKNATHSPDNNLLVKPGDHENSFLYKVLNYNVVQFPHSSISTLTTEDKTSINTWIDELENK